jgi:hypothetical protein
MKRAKKIPYGITNFEKIRTKDYIYIDKTRFIEQLENEQTDCHFLIRPRKFGKSLFTTMLDYYYDVRHAGNFDQLFGDLYIGQHPTPKRNDLFVLSLDFSGIDTSSIERFNISLLEMMQSAVVAYITDHKNFIKNSDEAKEKVWVKDTVRACVEFAFEIAQNNDKKVYVIIDEYDHFANDMIATGTYLGHTLYKKAVWAGSQIRDFYETLKANNKTIIDQIFITGITPIMLDDLTSGFNISSNLSLKDKYSELLGFTKEEVEQIIDECGIERSLIHTDIEFMFNGYLFNENAKNKLYNSTMIFNYFKEVVSKKGEVKNLVDRNLRTDYGRLRTLAERHDNRQKLRELLENKSVTANVVDQFSLERINDDRNFYSLLYYMGLVTIDNDDPTNMGLKIPNYSIQTMYWDVIEQMLTDEMEGISLDNSRYQGAMHKLAYEGIYEPFFDYLIRYVMSYLSNNDLQRTVEKDVKYLLLPIILTSNFYFPISELENSQGYTDIYLKRGILHPGVLSEWVWEIKYIKQKDAKKKNLIQAAKANAKEQLLRYKSSNLFKERTDVRYLSIVFVGKRGYEVDEI